MKFASFLCLINKLIVVETSTCGLTKKVLTGKNMRFSQTDMNVVIVLQKVNG